MTAKLHITFRHFLLLCFSVCIATSALTAQAIKVMLLDGESGGKYHRWEFVTPVLKKELEETGLFQVDVVTAPPAGGDFTQFHPQWKAYKVIVMNYDAPSDRWPDDLKASFEAYIRSGGGLVTVHAADNAFHGWLAFNEMIGVGGWRGRNEADGFHFYYDGGKRISDTKPGPAGHHGLRIPFKMTVRSPQHPIMRGLPSVWMHQSDELYDTLKGPGKNMTILATGYSDPANRGTGLNEPLLMAINFGNGRIFHSTLGHNVWGLSSVDFIVTFQRGVEWAATGKVTQKVPSTFPTATTVSYRADIAAMDPNYTKGMNPVDASPGSGLSPDQPPTK